MNILIDIGHPAHVHLLRYTGEELKRHGHHVFFSVRDIPVAKRLMDYYGMTYVDLGKKKDSIFGKGMTILSQDWKMLWFVWKNHIDIGLSSGIVLSHVSKLSKMKSFIFDDDDDAAEPLVVFRLRMNERVEPIHDHSPADDHHTHTAYAGREFIGGLKIDRCEISHKASTSPLFLPGFIKEYSYL